MKRIAFALLLCFASRAYAVSGVGSIGVKATGLTLPGGGTLNGSGVQIGQVEGLRAGKRTEDGGPDTAPNSAAAVNPLQVYMKTAVATTDGFRVKAGPPGFEIDHGEMVAGIMISTDGGAPGVSPSAGLHSASYAVSSTTQRDAGLTANHIATRNSGDIPTINMSFGMALDGGETLVDGNAHLTSFVDWSAASHDVLYVVAGKEIGGGDGPVPTDNYNGITVAASTSNMGADNFAQLWPDNDYSEDAGGEFDDRVSIDLLAPGANISVVHTGGAVDDIQSGTSLAAPHVTGAVALLQQYANHQITNAGWTDPNAKRHEVMKAILLNSADKLNGIHGSNRNILNKDGQIWQDTPAYGSPAMPLDMSFGAGHLNVSSAVTNFSPGEYEPGIVPRIGWDFSPLSESSSEYVLNESVPAGAWIAVTLAWDRLVTTNEVDNSYNATSLFDNNPIEQELVDLDLYLVDSNDEVVHSSVATADSVEHIFWQVPEGGSGNFKIQVINGGGGNEWPEGYALAWWAGELTSIPGDFNNDSNVDDADLNTWKSGFGPTYDGSDFLAWQQNYGFGVPATPTSAAVPEPAACLLVLIGLPMLLRRR